MYYLMIIWIGLLSLIFLVYSLFTGICFFNYKKIITYKIKNYQPKVTLVVPFFNEERIMARKIENISEIVYPKNKLKVIFLDDNSNDNSTRIITKNCSKLPFSFKTIKNKGERGKANALMYVLDFIDTEIFISSDCDTLVDKNSIKLLVNHFQDPKVGGVNARLLPLKTDTAGRIYREEISYRKTYDLWRRGESNIDSISVCNGALMSFRFSILKNFRFKKNKWPSADDTELVLFVIKKGYRVLYEKNALAYEILATSYVERLRQKMRRSVGLMQAYLKNLSLLKTRIFGKIIYPFDLAIYVLIPYITLISIIVYLVLIFKYPFMLLLLILFLIPKIGILAYSFIFNQIIMSFSPILVKSWNTADSSKSLGEKL